MLYLEEVHGKPPKRQENDGDDGHANQCLLVLSLVKRSCRKKKKHTHRKFSYKQKPKASVYEAQSSRHHRLQSSYNAPISMAEASAHSCEFIDDDVPNIVAMGSVSQSLRKSVVYTYMSFISGWVL